MKNEQLILSGFSDESANQKTMDQQFSAMTAMGLQYVSLRFVDAGSGTKNLMELDEFEIDRVATKLEEYHLRVSSIGSPIGKVKLLNVDDGTMNRFVPFQEYLQTEVQKACDLAVRFGSKLIRGFSFYHPKGQPPEEHLDAVIEQLVEIAALCDSHDLTFGLEVEANLVGQNGQLLAEIHRRVDSEALLLIFDGGNLVSQGYSQAEIFSQYQAMKPGLGWIHVKDFRNPDPMKRVTHVDEDALKHFVPVEHGNSGYLEILRDLKSYLPELNQRLARRGVDGMFADLEPHVKGGGQFGGFSGPDGFGVALRSFCKLCDQAHVGYHLTDFSDIEAIRGY
ncbi:MAG: sugar phosphate isomerase/epimerase [Mariniblastus sp.]|nr:sugar phosphate isomerase/epimerase [Mariniblastus sp.]